jgi:predicted GNAT superfamily acetyltransferase
MNVNASVPEISDIEIRDINGAKELRTVEELQREVWGVPDIDVVPLTQMVAVQAAGGVVIGAFDGENLVGFVYGFVSYEHGQTAHHSHMLAIRTEYRNFDLGSRLKLAQRERVLKQGINLMTWTFDPLQSRNAYINFNKLGVFSNRYIVNFYGEDAKSFLHQTGTDRLWVSWDLTNCHRERQIDKDLFNMNFGQLTPLVKVGADEVPLISDLEAGLEADHALIEIPFKIDDLVKRNSDQALKWREATRRAFTEALKKGFLVENFYPIDRHDQKLGVYLLTRKN